MRSNYFLCINALENKLKDTQIIIVFVCACVTGVRKISIINFNTQKLAGICVVVVGMRPIVRMCDLGLWGNVLHGGLSKGS